MPAVCKFAPSFSCILMLANPQICAADVLAGLPSLRRHDIAHLVVLLSDSRPPTDRATMTKVDLVPTWVTKKWVKLLSATHPTLAFHASITNSFGKGALINLLRQVTSALANPARRYYDYLPARVKVGAPRNNTVTVTSFCVMHRRQISLTRPCHSEASFLTKSLCEKVT